MQRTQNTECILKISSRTIRIKSLQRLDRYFVLRDYINTNETSNLDRINRSVQLLRKKKALQSNAQLSQTQFPCALPTFKKYLGPDADIMAHI